MDVKTLVKTKTFWAGIALVISGVAAVVTGEQTPVQAAQVVLGGFAAIFLRQGVGKADGSQDKTLPPGGVQ